MRLKCIFRITVLVLFSYFGWANNDTLKIPFERKLGSLSFAKSSGAVNIKNDDTTNPWNKIFTPIKGVPTEWGAAYLHGRISLNMYQSTYQNYYLGYITEKHFNDLKRSWDWTPNEDILSKKPIQCYLSVILKKVSDTSLVYRIDTDGDLDFSKEQEHILIENDDYLVNEFFQTFTYETYRNGKVIKQTSPIKFGYRDGRILYHIPERGIAHYTKDGITETLIFEAGNSVNYKNAELIKVSDTSKENMNLLFIKQKQYINLGKNVYQYSQVSEYGDTLIFIKKDIDINNFVAPQYGFKAPVFKGKNILTNKTISLDQYKGKYVLIDIWATWCMPCINDLPFFKTAYDNLDRNKIEFISIAGSSKEKDVRKLLEKHKITWPQLIINDKDPIIKDYNVTGFPITLLIAPNGKIIHNSIRGEYALKSINEAIEAYEKEQQ